MAVIRPFTGDVAACELILTPDNLTDTAAVVGCVKMQRGAEAPTNLQRYVIYVGESQGMVLCRNGRVTEGVTDPGYYEISRANAPQLFGAQQIFYLNAKEIRGIRFGTQSPLCCKDAATGAEQSVRCFGTFSLRIVNPLQLCNGLFADGLERLDFNESSAAATRLKEEFLSALQRAVNRFCAEGGSPDAISGQDVRLAQYTAAELEENWGRRYGLSLTALEIARADADAAQSMPQSATMLADAPVAAAAPIAPTAESGDWHCPSCGANNRMKFCTECGTPRPQVQPVPEPQTIAEQPAPAPISEPQTITEQSAPVPTDEPVGWQCSCGTVNTTRFCANCGMQPPARLSWQCKTCGAMTAGGVCTECGAKKS